MNAVEWAERCWLLPETGKPVVLRPWQKAVLLAMFPEDGSPSPYETFLISTVKKAGKTTLNAVATLYAALTFPAPETAYCVANDEAQAQERVFDLISKAVRTMGLERTGAATVSRSEITFPETGTRVVAIPADFAGAAGAIFGVSSWTELWAFRYEGHIRLWEELTPVPERRSLRIVDSYAGFVGDSPILEPMWARALAGERIGELPVYAAGRLWAFIDQGQEAQRRAWRGGSNGAAAYYGEQAASLRPGTFNRLHLNQWQSGEEAFVTAEDWDACVDGGLRPILPGSSEAGRLWLSVGVDAATKGDCAAVVAVAHDGERVRLCSHRIWTPKRGRPIDLEQTVESYMLELARGFRVSAVYFDPFQMARSAATLKRAGVPMVELPQTTANLTASGQGLFELIRGRNLALYADKEMRQHALNAVAIETPRGWRLAKEKAARKIDGVVALSFATLGVVRRTFAGAAFPAFAEQVHVVPDLLVPEAWAQFEALSCGPATAWLAFAVDHAGNVLVTDEFSGSALPSEAVPRILERRKGNRAVCYAAPDLFGGRSAREARQFGDPACLADEFADCGVPLVIGNGDRQAGLTRVGEMLRSDETRVQPEWAARSAGTGAPRLYVAASCVNLIEALRAAPLEEDGEPLPGAAVSRRWESRPGLAIAALRLGLMSRPSPSREPEQTPDDPRAAWLWRNEQKFLKRQKQPRLGRYVNV